MIHICFQNLEMNKRLAYGNISTELYNKSLAYSYTKFIGNFEETVRFSFNPINHYTTGNYIVGSRCSAITPWKHGRVLVLKGEGSDPYDASQQKYQVIDDSLTYSTPTRTVGVGTGNIEVSLATSQTQGCQIYFGPNNKAQVYCKEELVAESYLEEDTWTLYADELNMVISNDTINSFLEGDQLFFSILSDTDLYEKIKIE